MANPSIIPPRRGDNNRLQTPCKSVISYQRNRG
nr:MAG TPA: hypothetical protein [Microviridae sp.]